MQDSEDTSRSRTEKKIKRDISAGLCFERKREIAYVGPLVSRGICLRLSSVMKRKIKRFVWETTSAEVNFKVSFKMTGLLKYLYQFSLIKINISYYLPKGLCRTQTGEFLLLKRFISTSFSSIRKVVSEHLPYE